MACISPPELDEKTLLKYLDGEADEHVTGHLQHCPHCRERARRLAHLQARLTTKLYRAACPSPLELGEYHLHILPRLQRAAVARHLAECSRCSGEIARLDGYLRELAPDMKAGAVERIKVLAAQLVAGGRRLGGPALAPAYAGVRGEATGPLLYQADKAQIALTVRQDSQRPALKMILGLMTGIAAEAWQVSLWREGERVAGAVVDELGNFVLAGLTPATYELSIAGPDTEIHIQDLDIGAG